MAVPLEPPRGAPGRPDTALQTLDSAGGAPDAVPILLVDDKAANLEALEVTLSAAGCTFVQARSADEALLALLEHEFAAIVLDIQMPRMNGIELANLIKRRRRTRHIPILFLTAHMMDEQDALLGYRAGAVDYLTKPISPEILRAKVAVFVDLYRKRQALAQANEALQREIGERQRAEEALRLANRELETRVQERTSALREADKRKDDFLAALAHELRNPLAALRSAVEVVRLKTPGHSELAGPQGVMDRQLKQMKRLIDDLLDVSRITRDQLLLQKSTVDLARVIEAAVETSRPSLEARQQTLTVRMPDEPIQLQADLVRLAQVFSNLLDNAAKYSEPGGQVRLTVETAQDQVYVRVEDSGIGFERAALPDLFEPFKQVARTGRDRSGLGIGLSLVRRLVEMHGGGVVARSEGPGKGSEFVVRLPRNTDDAPLIARTSGDHREPLPTRSLRVLVVEDNRDAAGMMQTLLAAWGQDVKVANDPIAALDLAEDFRPEVVLLDIGLPRLHGYDVARRIRKTGWGRKATLVAVTGWGQQADREQSKAAGIDHHLLKPLDPAALQDLLHSIQGRDR